VTTVVIPWRPSDVYRQRALEFVLNRYATHHPGWRLVLAELPAAVTWSKGRAITNANLRSGDVAVVADADVVIDPPALAAAVDRVANGEPWGVPHLNVHRLSLDSTLAVYAGASPVGLPLSTDNSHDRSPYRGLIGGGIVIVPVDTLRRIPPDPRFEGWGHEDLSWGRALKTLCGGVERGTADLFHLWHPPQQRSSRACGSPESMELENRYRHANKRPDRMRALIEEVTA